VSFEAVTWVKNLPHETCSYGAFRILLILAEHATPEGKRAFRSKSKIADTLGCSTRSVQRWYNELAKLDLIELGNQAYVAHIDRNRRPTVYNINIDPARGVRFVDENAKNETPKNQNRETKSIGETRLSTGNLGETTVVAGGETTVVVSKNQKIEPLNSSIKADHSTHPEQEKDAYGDSSTTAIATPHVDEFPKCINGHSMQYTSGGGVQFCASGCRPNETEDN